MSSAQKIIQAAAGNAAGEGTYVEDVFSTYVYEGNGSTQTITNGVDLDGEGGLVWFKNRPTSNTYHALYDTERGTEKYLMTNVDNAEQTFLSNGVTSFNSDGFVVSGTSDWFNANGEDIVSWTFRKAPKFFDVVTYTGTGVAQNISHNLGSVPGMIIVKAINDSKNWAVYHRSMGDGTGGQYTSEEIRMFLNLSNSYDFSTALWNDTAPTDTHFTVGTDGTTNESPTSYVAYLFAHNDGDGEFGEDADQDIIKCGSFTSTTGDDEVDLGFEPQWLLVKKISNSGSWIMLDNMRTFDHSETFDLRADTSAQEESGYGSSFWKPTSNGFIQSGNWSSGDYIYIAIRRGPMKTPEDATEVFAIDSRNATEPGWVSGFPVDWAWKRNAPFSTSWNFATRLTQGTTLIPSTTDAEFSNSNHVFDYMNGWASDVGTYSTFYSWMFRRAPGFFDVVAYEGNGTAGHEISHNLGVVPEMMIVKARIAGGYDWMVYHKDLGNTALTKLNEAGNQTTRTGFLNATTPTDSVFTLGTDQLTNGSTVPYIAYLFATLPGVSKVGSFTTTGSDLNVDCGFTNGARFILLKKTSAAENWGVFDTERGIVAGNDPFLALNTTDAESTSSDAIDPLSSGFTLVGNFWGSGSDYIFLAIA